MARHERNGNAGSTKETIIGVLAYLTTVIPRVARALDTLGAIAGFRLWSQNQGSHSIYLTRQRLWEKEVVPILQSHLGEVRILEFGVAYGEASRWWLNQIQSEQLRYFGFDLFTGLPRAWRNMPAHAFDAGGQTPNIDDSRVTWIKGDVSETVVSAEFGGRATRKFFFRSRYI